MRAGRLLDRVAPGRLGDLALLDHLRQSSGGRVAVGVQGLRHGAGGAMRVVVEVVVDARGDVALALTRRGASGAGAACGRSAQRALRRRRALITVTLAEFLDLAIKPSETLLQIGALGFKRVDDLLQARHVILPGRDELEVIPYLVAGRMGRATRATPWPPCAQRPRGRRCRSAPRLPRGVVRRGGQGRGSEPEA